MRKNNALRSSRKIHRNAKETMPATTWVESRTLRYSRTSCGVVTGAVGVGLTLKLCGANEAQRSLRPNERLVMSIHYFHHN